MKKNDFDVKLFASRFSSLLEQSIENTHTLAKKLDLSPATISRYAHGVMTPKLITLYAIADIFEVNPLWLMGWEESETSPTSNKPLSDSIPEKNTIKIAGRDGSYLERRLTDDQLDLIKKMIDQMPEANDL